MKGIPVRVLAAYSLYASPKKSLRKCSSNLMRTAKKRHTYSMASVVSMLQRCPRCPSSSAASSLAQQLCMVPLPLCMHIGRRAAGSSLQYHTSCPSHHPWVHGRSKLLWGCA